MCTDCAVTLVDSMLTANSNKKGGAQASVFRLGSNTLGYFQNQKKRLSYRQQPPHPHCCPIHSLLPNPPSVVIFP